MAIDRGWKVVLVAVIGLCFVANSGCKKPPKVAKARKVVAKTDAAPEPEDAGEQEPDVPPKPAKKEARPGPDKAPDDVAKPPADATKSRSGLATKLIFAGTGEHHPSGDDTVFIHHATWTVDGKFKANTWRKKEPKILKMSKLMPGWSEGLAQMVVGERRRMWIPEKLALARSQRRKGSKGMRVVDLELLRLKRAPAAPEDVTRPPKDAKKTASGLAWKLLKAGDGAKRPTATSQVTVRYAGWTTKGRCFDHTDTEETMTFPLNGVIAGWTEGLQLMSIGGKGRFWLPQKIAYDGQQGKPAGTLVFDIELLEVMP